MRRHSLRWRLLFVVCLCVGTAFLGLAFASSRVVASLFEHFLENEARPRPPPDLERFRGLLESHYRRAGSWRDVGSVLDTACRELGESCELLLISDGSTTGVWMSRRLAGWELADADDALRALERRQADGRTMRKEWLRSAEGRLELRDAGGRSVGHLVHPPTVLDHRPVVFVESANRWLFRLAIPAAALLSLVLTSLLSRRILEPVEELTAAARKMKDGKLEQRIQVRSSDEIGELAATFNAMAGELNRLEAARRNMVHDVAHELRTPLTNVRCQLEAMLDHLQAPTAEALASLHEELLHLNRLIEDLRQVAQSDAGRLRLSPEDFDVGPEIERVVRQLAPLEDDGRTELSIDVPAGLGVHADPVRFRQVMSNLLKNAMAHTPAGGRIVVRARHLEDRVEVSVEDTGAGIASHDLPHVFDRFYRADASRSRATGGSGLGLAIVKHLVEAQGGQVSVRSAPRQGACFSLTLPSGGDR